MQQQSQHKYYNHTNNQHYIVECDGRKVCVCQLCTCGNHKICPTIKNKQTFQTSYSREFKPFQPILQIDTRPPYRYQQRHYPPDTLMTNYQQHYQKQPHLITHQSPTQEMMNNSRLSQIAKTILAPPVKFVGVTSYHEQYRPYQKVKIQQNYQNPQQDDNDVLSPYRKSQLYQKPVIKFEGQSSYKSTYLPPPKVKKQYQAQTYKKPQAPFYGTSSYKQQYKPIGIIPPKKQLYDSYLKPQNSRIKFQGKSAYKEQYLPYQVSRENLNNLILGNSQISCKLDEINIPQMKFTNCRV